MDEGYRESESRDVMSVGMSVILTIITCGIYGIYWQYRQIEALNRMLRRDEFSFGLWLLLSIVTCGIFAVYYEYKMAKGINDIQEKLGQRVNSDLALICVVLTLFGIGIASLAIQQGEINRFYDADHDF